MKTDFSKIEYDDDSHTYIYDNIPLESVTMVCKRCTPAFNEEEVLAALIAKNGGTREEWKAKWKKKGDEAANLGTLIHSLIEKYLSGEDISFLLMNDNFPQFRAAKSKLDEFKKMGVKLFKKEWVIGDAELLIGGRLDAIFEFPNKILSIVDWKTGTTLGKQKIANYSWQINLYRLILERNPHEFAGYTLGNSAIIHLRDDGQPATHQVINFTNVCLSKIRGGAYNRDKDIQAIGLIHSLEKTFGPEYINDLSTVTTRKLISLLSRKAEVLSKAPGGRFIDETKDIDVIINL